MSWPATRTKLMKHLYARELTPKEVLLLLVDLNERYNGQFEKAHNALATDIDFMTRG